MGHVQCRPDLAGEASRAAELDFDDPDVKASTLSEFAPSSRGCGPSCAGDDEVAIYPGKSETRQQSSSSWDLAFQKEEPRPELTPLDEEVAIYPGKSETR